MFRYEDIFWAGPLDVSHSRIAMEQWHSFSDYFKGILDKLHNLSRWLWENKAPSQLPAEITQSAFGFSLKHTYMLFCMCNIYKSQLAADG